MFNSTGMRRAQVVYKAQTKIMTQGNKGILLTTSFFLIICLEEETFKV